MGFDLNSTGVRAAIGAVLLAVGLIAGWFLHKAVMAPPDIPRIAMYDDWRLACPEMKEQKGSCEMQEDVLDSKTRTGLARFTIFQLNGKNTMMVTVPFNVLLTPGIAIGLNKDKPHEYPYETCTGVGCLVRVPLDDKFFDAMGKANEARLIFAGLDGKPVGILVSLKGFKDAQAAYNDTEEKRHSWWRRLWS